MSQKFCLLPVDFAFQAAEPSIQVMLSKRMRNLVVVLERVLHVLLGDGELFLFREFHVADSSLATG